MRHRFQFRLPVKNAGYILNRNPVESARIGRGQLADQVTGQNFYYRIPEYRSTLKGSGSWFLRPFVGAAHLQGLELARRFIFSRMAQRILPFGVNVPGGIVVLKGIF